MWIYLKYKKSVHDGKYAKAQHLLQTAASALNHYVVLAAPKTMSMASMEEINSAGEKTQKIVKTID